MKNVPLFVLLSFNGGYVDTVGFLALSGLFSAHVTGNFVTLGATVALGVGGGLAKLLALPVFCIIVFSSRIVGLALKKRGFDAMRPALATQLTLLVIAFGLAEIYGPFVDAGSWSAFSIGMVLVSAMAIQNGLHRVHLSKSPPTTLMTGTTTQIMLDLADLVAGVDGEARSLVIDRLGKLSISVLAFAFGCGIAAGWYIISPTLCFVLPAFILAIAFLLREETQPVA